MSTLCWSLIGLIAPSVCLAMVHVAFSSLCSTCCRPAWLYPRSCDAGEIAKPIDSGKLTPIVETVLPLSEARKAHELNERGHTRGKIVLKVA